MRAYVINLDERTDRMDEFRKNQLPFSVERISAIRTDPGWEGCTQSHLEVIRKAKVPFIVLEDDCVMLQSWEVVSECMKELPEGWDALWLGGTLMVPVERYSPGLIRIREVFCAHAIIYNSQRIKDYIVNEYENYINLQDRRKTIDVFYAYDVQYKFNCFMTDPLCATQLTGYSDIEKLVVNYTQIIEHFNIYTNAGK